MPTSKTVSESVVKTILQTEKHSDIIDKLKPRMPKDDPLPERLRRETVLAKDAQVKRLETLEEQNANLDYVIGKKQIDDPSIFAGNIESYIGLAQMPIGVIGPLRINGMNAHGDFYVPLATTEGALVASYNRGSRVISMSGGASAICLVEKLTRAPAFVFNNISESALFVTWVVKQLEKFREVTKTKTSHGKLVDFKITVNGNIVFLNLEYTTGDASGQNMVTVTTDAICNYIADNSPVKSKHSFVEGNLSGDKKATALSHLSVRGKKVCAEVIIPRKVFMRFLHTTPEMMLEYAKVSCLGGIQSGSIGVNGHYSNALAAIFIACGQDAACVSEASVGITRVELTENGDLYMGASLPNLIVGTVGGGTGLPTQNECLTLLGCKGLGTAKKFAEICAVTVLAGEISIMGAIAAGHFSSAHESYGRKKK